MMRWRQDERGEWTTQVAQWVSEGHNDKVSARLQRPIRYWHSFYTSRLLQEAGNVLPYRDGVIVLRGGDSRVERMIADGIGADRGRGRGVTAAVREFACLCAPLVIAFDRCAYEIVFARTTEQGAPSSFRLVHVGNYASALGRHWQFVPPSNEGTAGRWVRLDPSQLVVFDMGPAVRRRTRRMMNGLATAGEHHMRLPALATGELPYDFAAHRRLEDVAVSRLSRHIGWNALMNSSEYQREPYQVFRALRWYEFKANLRDMIIRQLNDALRRAGEACGFSAQLHCRGLYGAKEINAARQQLEDGRCERLVDILEPFRSVV